MNGRQPLTSARDELPPPVDPDERALEELAGCIGDFVAAWEQAGEVGPPEIDRFLPASADLRSQALFELIKVDLECRWNVFDLPKQIDEYVEDFPELRDGGLPASLIYEEYRQRCDSGATVSLEEYLQNYPEHAASLKQLHDLGLHVPSTIVSESEGPCLEDFVPGETVDDFDLLVQLGRGAFARVFLARQRSMQRLVALKISLNKGTEAQTLAQLDHDYIVRVFDQHVLPEQNLRLLYMQYLPGGTLHSVVRRVAERSSPERRGSLLLEVIDATLDERGEIRPTDSTLRARLNRMSWPETVAWMGVRLAEGLGYAHSRGVLHRDIKPANVLLTAEGVPKLADFNISFGGQVEGTNPTAYFGGSLAYMSPEHLEAFHPGLDRQAEDLDGRADLYSLGVMLWELLAGRRPFREAKGVPGTFQPLEEMLASRRAGPAGGEVMPLPGDVPCTLRRVLTQCLSPERADRWQSAEELARQLRIALEPRARQLIDPPDRSWAEWLSRRAVWIVLLMNLIPNVVAAVGNYLYNKSIIMDPSQRDTLDRIQGIVNGIAFPIGIGLIIYLAWRVRRQIFNPAAVVDARRAGSECLKLGDRCALICLSLWTIAGIAYPLIIQSTGVELSAGAYGHFFFSLFLCGLIATAYPFFGVTLFAVRYLFPALFRRGVVADENRQSLQKLRGRLKIYLWMAASIPLLATLAVTFVQHELIWLVRSLCFGGLVAFAGAYWLFSRMEEDLSALSQVLEVDGP